MASVDTLETTERIEAPSFIYDRRDAFIVDGVTRNFRRLD
jgi:hypothetical protein